MNLAVALLAAVLSAGSPATQAQDRAESGDPAAFDVGGVKLGMTPDEAAAALKSFDPTFTVTRRYLGRSNVSYGLEGREIAGFPPRERNAIYLNDLLAVNATSKIVCDKYNPSWCDSKYDKDLESIVVWFSIAPGQERVIAIERTKTFYKGPKPAIASLKSGLFAKYPEPQPTFAFTAGNQPTIGWLFNPRGQLLSPAAAKSKRLAEGGGLPRTVKPGDGIGLNVFFTPNNLNPQLAEAFSLTLYDGNALYRSIGQSKAVYDALKAKADADEVEHDVPPPTKF